MRAGRGGVEGESWKKKQKKQKKNDYFRATGEPYAFLECLAL